MKGNRLNLKSVGKEGTIVVTMLLLPSRFKTQYIRMVLILACRQCAGSSNRWDCAGVKQSLTLFIYLFIHSRIYFFSNFDTLVLWLKWELRPAECSRVLMWEGNWSARCSSGSGDRRCRCDAPARSHTSVLQWREYAHGRHATRELGRVAAVKHTHTAFSVSVHLIYKVQDQNLLLEQVLTPGSEWKFKPELEPRTLIQHILIIEYWDLVCTHLRQLHRPEVDSNKVRILSYSPELHFFFFFF